MLLPPPPKSDTAQPSNTTIKIMITATQPPATMAAINAFVPAIIAFTADTVTFAVVLTAAADAFAVARAACAAFWAVLADAFAAACADLAVVCVVLMAAFEVACAVLTDFCVVLTVPFAAVLIAFLLFRAFIRNS